MAVHAFAISFWALTFWGTIALLDRGNPKNTLGVALATAAVCDLVHFGGIPDIFYLGAWLVFLLRLTTWRYHLTLLGAIIVTAVTVFAPYLLAPALLRFVGDSELRAYAMIYGLPIVTFGTWIVSLVGNRRPRPEAAQDAVLPTARVTRWRKAPVATPAVFTAPTAMPVAPLRAPEPAPIHGDKPTFLT